MNTYYDILGISSDAEAEVVAAAYKALMRKYHPDVNKSQHAQEKAQIINEAYHALSSPEKRKQYDETLVKQGGGGSNRDNQRKPYDNSEHFSKNEKEFEEFQAFKRHQAYQDFRRHQNRQYWADVAKSAATAAKENISRVSENAKRTQREPLNWEPVKRLIICATLFFVAVMLTAFIYAAYEEHTKVVEEANAPDIMVEQTDHERSASSLNHIVAGRASQPQKLHNEPYQRVPTLGEFVDNIANAANIAREEVEVRGLSGARLYSQSCSVSAESSSDVLKTDFCVAFDMFVAAFDHSFTSSSGMPADSYFQEKVENFEQLYARFRDVSPSRVSLIWEEMKQYL